MSEKTINEAVADFAQYLERVATGPDEVAADPATEAEGERLINELAESGVPREAAQMMLARAEQIDWSDPAEVNEWHDATQTQDGVDSLLAAAAFAALLGGALVGALDDSDEGDEDFPFEL